MHRLSRSALIAGGATLLAVMALTRALAPAAQGLNPHVDPILLPQGCIACHRGHGESGSPMLPGPQKEVCLACHGSSGSAARMASSGLVAESARPTPLSEPLSQLHVHPVSESAFSRSEPGQVTCTSCHSPHRSSIEPAALPVTSAMRTTTLPSSTSPSATLLSDLTAFRGPRISTVDPTRFEYELCGNCHGNGLDPSLTVVDIGRRMRAGNRSYHPVMAPPGEGSSTVVAEIAGRQLSCTDCHGNSNPLGPRGPHGSAVPFILRANYNTLDGAVESPTEYALCYTCHLRASVIDGSSFSGHRRHVVEERISCATCHDGHGSVTNRALIRFGEDSGYGAVLPSMVTGRLEFVSFGPGSGECYLSCHGVEHGPERY